MAYESWHLGNLIIWDHCSASLCIKDIGLPPGVVNMVFGYGKTVGESIVTHPEVKIVSFTGR